MYIRLLEQSALGVQNNWTRSGGRRQVVIRVRCAFAYAMLLRLRLPHKTDNAIHEFGSCGKQLSNVLAWNVIAHAYTNSYKYTLYTQTSMHVFGKHCILNAINILHQICPQLSCGTPLWLGLQRDYFVGCVLQVALTCIGSTGRPHTGFVFVVKQ